jgi:TonB-dependent starch-binding outer membrane protein SusC
MRSKFKWILTLTLAFLMQFSYAQEKTITGTVTESGQPLPGVTVLVKGTTRGTQTDFDGKYSIRASVGETLEFSYVGQKTQNIVVGASSVINVVMEEDVAMLAEVVLVSEGYRATTKAKSVSAVSVVGSETLENRPNPSVLQTMQGQVAGFTIRTGSGQPGAISQTIIRGVGSISGNTEPLYVIDGVPQSGSSFRAINPEDIESFNVLKDAAAVAQYGNRGSNGVVVVTTRRGKSREFSEVVVTSTTGVATLQNNYYNKMNSRELLGIERARGASGLGTFLTPEEIAAYSTSTDWKDVLLRDATTRTVNVAITGGGEKIRSFTSFNYNETEGLSNMSNFNRFTFRNNLDGKAMNDKLSYSTSLSIAFVRDNRVPSLGTGSVNQNPMLAALLGLPYLSPNDYVSGTQLNQLVRNQIADSPFTNRVPLLGYTPLLIMDLERNRTFRFNEFQIFGSTKLRYDLTKDISVNNTFGVDYTQFTSTQSQGPNGFNAIYFAQNDGKPFGGSQAQLYEHDAQMANTFSVNFSKEFNEKHSVDFGLYTEALWATLKSFNYTTNGLNPLTYYPGSGQGYVPEDPNNFAWYRRFVGSNINRAALLSYFALADYDYDSKFGIAASIRRDGSYRFRGNNTFGTFWSVGGRINFDKMSFMSGSKFDMLKLRISYGTAGNQNIAGQSLYALPNFFRDQYALSNAYLGQQGAFPILGNDDVRWERTTNANIGLDVIYNSRLRANLDVYQKVTSDLFIPILTSAIAGQTSINGNFGEITNRGIELTLNYDLIKPATPDGLKVNIWANGSYNVNEITDLPPDSRRVPLGNNIRQVGGPVGEYFVFQHAGINPTTGNHLFVTADGNLTETPNEADRVATGLSFIPKYQGGFGFNIDYKNFYLTTQFNYEADLTRFDYDLAAFSDPTSIGQFNLSRDLLRHWTPTNTITDQPSLFVANQGFAEDSTRFLVDASYLRIRNVQLGYNFPKKLFNDRAGVKVFVTGENLYTWTKWRGWDPESTRSADFYQFPQPRFYTVGAQVNF